MTRMVSPGAYLCESFVIRKVIYLAPRVTLRTTQFGLCQCVDLPHMASGNGSEALCGHAVTGLVEGPKPVHTLLG